MLALALFGNEFTPLNTDLGWMLRWGRDTAAMGHPPTTNLYSFTEPDRRLVMFEWLFNWMTFELHDRWGAAGIIGMKYVYIVLTVLGLFASLTRVSRRPLLLFGVGLGATQLMWMGFELTRAQLATLAGVAACTAAALDGRRIWLWACVPMIGLWTNLHGGFAEGLVVLVVLGAAQLVEERLGWAERQIRGPEMMLLLGAAILATAANPYDRAELIEAVKLSGSSARLLDREWLPLYRFSELGIGEVWAWVLLGTLVVLALLLLRRRQFKLWLLLAMGVGTSVMASRHLRTAPLLLGPVLLALLEDGMGRWEESLARLEQAVRPTAAGAAALLGSAFVWRLPDALRSFLDYGGLPNPAGVVAVMKLNAIAGKVWNDFDWGGLLLWAVPDVKVACDGRHFFAYSAEMIDTSVNFPGGQDPTAVLEHFGAELVLLPRAFPSLPRITEKYPAIYCDDDACLLSKRPEDGAKRDAGLRLPNAPLLPSDFFTLPRLPPTGWDGHTNVITSVRAKEGAA